jgi:WD40-like Beta Propeller Repeat
LKGRDLAIVAAVVLLGGFALADSLRSRGGNPSEPTATTATEAGPAPRPEAPADWPTGRIRGTLVFTDARDCRVRAIGLGGGRERPTGELVGFCNLWAAPIGQRIAYSTGGVRGSTGESFAVVDLRRAGIELATFQNLAGDVLWSPDAQRLAWCTESGVGQEFEIGTERPRSLARCPVAYTPEGRLALAVGRRLVSDGRTLVRERDPITQAYWGEDESLLVVLAGGTIRRYDPGGGIDSIGLSTDGDVIPSPDNCGLVYEEPGRIHIADVGCYGGRLASFIAYDAAWSPDGRWLAVAGTDQIEFHDVLTDDERLVWPARAVELYWRGQD